jgi:hypothetical protein
VKENRSAARAISYSLSLRERARVREVLLLASHSRESGESSIFGLIKECFDHAQHERRLYL